MSEAPDVRGTVALLLHEQRHIDVYLNRRQVRRPPGERVLMVGPHPDDNLFGPGGTTMRFVEDGASVEWICVTDGRACVPGRAERERIARLRAEEERACARRIGVGEAVLYGIPEDALTTPEGSREAVERLVQDLGRVRPDALFVPYFLETHPLHRYTTHLCALALRAVGASCTVYQWGHGSFPPPSLVVDITDLFGRKRELARCYASQLGGRDWETELDLLGRLHAAFARDEGTRHAEVFFALPSEDFVPDVLSRGLDRPETLGTGVQPMVPEEEPPARG